MTLKERIDTDLKEAMRAKDRVRLETLRSVLSQFSYKRIEAGHELGESEQLEVIRRLVKQRTDSINEFQRAQRTDLVEKETLEREILKSYLPAELSDEEIRNSVRTVLAGLDSAMRNEGAAMKQLMPQFKGKADGSVVRAILQEELKAAAP